jgi:transcriptional regulator with PAS, ATPase and Fis domain
MEVLKGTKCQADCPLLWSFANAKSVDRCQETLRPGEGRRLEISVTTAMLHDTEGRLVGLTGIVNDRSEVERLRRRLHEQQAHSRIIGRSPRMRELFQLIDTVSDTDATVLITGDSGTGKEMVARAIHERSARREKPFVTLNCAALNDNLLESELFGHVRGAFTGAVSDKQGRFELAAGGTILLDEIGDTTPALQAKLLRVLQEKTFERVGDTRTRRVDVRVIAATNRDLRSLVDAGRFREDLYYRLAVVPIDLPALRDRREDVPLLVQYFMDKYRPRYFKDREDAFEGISNRALALMMAYDWPGNVRELEHAVEYAMISTTTGRIERAFLPLPLRRLQPPEDPRDATAPPAAPPEDEEAALRRALEANRWSVARTAAALGISRTTLWRRMRRFELTTQPTAR